MNEIWGDVVAAIAAMFMAGALLGVAVRVTR